MVGNRALELTWTMMGAQDLLKRAAEMSTENAKAVDPIEKTAARVFMADKAIPEEIVKLTGNFVTEYQTKVPSPEIMTRTVFRGMPSPDELMEGDVIYFRRQGTFRHYTGWDRVVLLGKWDEFLITASRSYYQK